MSTATANKAPMVAIGQIKMAKDDQTIGTILGSCVGVVLFHRKKKIGVLAHIVLPESAGRQGSPGKFADTAIPEMINMLAEQGISKSDLMAKIAGGANMFGSSGPMQIGQKNYDAVKAALKAEKIRIVAEHMGGKKGRRILFNPTTSKITIEIVGQDAEVI